MERWGFQEIEHSKILSGAVPLRRSDIEILKKLGVKGVIDLTEHSSPIKEFYQEYDIAYTNLVTIDLKATNLENIMKFFDFYKEHKSIYIHCQVGEGRTGMFLATYFINKYKFDPINAIKLVRRRRELSIHTKEQLELIYQFAETLNMDFDMTRVIPPDSFDHYKKPEYDIFEGTINYIELQSPNVDYAITLNFFNNELNDKYAYYEGYILKLIFAPVTIEEIIALRHYMQLSTENETPLDIKYKYIQDNSWVKENVDNKEEIIEVFKGNLIGMRFHILEKPYQFLQDDKYIKYKGMSHPTTVLDTFRLELKIKVDRVSSNDKNPNTHERFLDF